MLAGFVYSFKIQGRDNYSNNLQAILSSAVGSNMSSIMSLSTNSGVTYTASIVDDTSGGVYRVEIDLPKQQTLGIYNYNVYLGGQLVSTPQVDIIECTNAYALTEGLVVDDGTTTSRGNVEYTIEATTTTISLVNVEIYCVQTRI